jgi:hypothetical protein
MTRGCLPRWCCALDLLLESSRTHQGSLSILESFAECPNGHLSCDSRTYTREVGYERTDERCEKRS